MIVREAFAQHGPIIRAPCPSPEMMVMGRGGPLLVQDIDQALARRRTQRRDVDQYVDGGRLRSGASLRPNEWQ